MTVLAPVLLAALLARQSDPNRILEGVAAQAGEGIVTLSEYERITRRAMERDPPRNREAEDRMRSQIALELAAWRLEEERGKDLGLDPAQLERIRRMDLQAERERTGLQVYLAQLKAEGKDALAEESDRERDILRYLWEQSALGRPFGVKRASRDAELRPGELREIYAENKDKLDPITVQLRLLFVSSKHVGSPDAARATCEEARARVEAGEDLALLVEEHGDDLRDTRGLTPYLPPRSLPDPALAAFAETAEISDLSAVIPATNPRGEPAPEIGYLLAELTDRRTPEVPKFEKPEVQRLLRKTLRDRRDQLILGRERDRLLRQGYVWVSPLVPAPGRPSDPEQR